MTSPPLRIRKAEPRDAHALARLCAETLGPGYLGQAEILRLETYIAAADANAAGLVRVDRLGAGTLCARFASLASARVPPPLQSCDRHGLVCVIETLAVAGARQRAGIGTALFEHAQARCADAGTSAVLVPVWRRDGPARLERILARASYTLLQELPGYWKRNCEAGRFECPARPCTGRCACSMALYWKLVGAATAKR